MFPARLINSWRNVASAISELQRGVDDASGVIPVGGLMPTLLDSAKHTAPVGWLFCDGRKYAVTQYPALARLLGNRFGGDGTTTFAVPDLHGASPDRYTLVGGYVAPEYVSTGSVGAAAYGVGCILPAAVTNGSDVPYRTFLASWLVRAK